MHHLPENDTTLTLPALGQCPPATLARARYGVVIRPPSYKWDGDHFVCDRLVEAELAAARSPDDEIQLVREGDFVAVVAKTLVAARNAARSLTLRWQTADTSVPDTVEDRRHGPQASRLTGARALESAADVELAQSDHRGDYTWPSRMGWGEAPGWVLADYAGDTLELWGQTATPQLLAHDIACATGLEPRDVQVFSEHAEQHSGLGRHCGDDAGVDAALMSRALGCPVAVWLDAEYMRDVQGLGHSQRMSLGAVRDSGGRLLRYAYRQRHLCGEVPAVGLLLSGRLPEWRGDSPPGSDHPASSWDVGNQDVHEDDTASLFPYDVSEQRISIRNRGVAAGSDVKGLTEIQQVFARESFLDEVAHAEEEDPVALRLAHLTDVRGSELIRSVSRRAEWHQRDPVMAASTEDSRDCLAGRGFAYSQRPGARQEIEAGSRSAWIADVEVNRLTGDVTLTRLVVGQDAGTEVDTACLQETLQARVLGERFPVLGHETAFDEWGDGRSSSAVVTQEEASFSSLRVTAATEIVMPQQQGVASAGVPASVDLAPGVAVIANALFDATGVRFRQPPFTASRVRAALSASGQSSKAAEGKGEGKAPDGRTRSAWWKRSLLTVAASAITGTAIMAWPWKGAIAPIARPAANLYSAETIERGRLVAAAGDCVACHTSDGGIENAGGRRFDTPFGTLYSTNLTPDEATGIGQWSYAAFERAMRHGVGREGHNLYPAFPYTAFAKTSDADMQALYAYLMAQPAVAAEVPENALKFPFNRRELLAGWNLLNHDSSQFMPDPAQSDLYNRGAYLAEGLGHCSACHTPRNALGAERSGDAYLAGAMVDGWEAPALSQLNRSPVAWSESALYDYLRTGKSALHGVASGPMAPVVAGLAELPEHDVRAIAHYVAVQMGAPWGEQPVMLQEAADRVRLSRQAPAGMEEGDRLFEGACASCHVELPVASFSSATTSLALNTNLHSGAPDNVIHSILGGVHMANASGVADMPGFAESFTNAQVTTLTRYLQARFAPDSSPWRDVEQRVSQIREEHH